MKRNFARVITSLVSIPDNALCIITLGFYYPKLTLIMAMWFARRGFYK